ncbi:MAG: PLP-dependent aminotransferase family protein [Chloroflexota bacterium]
MTVTPTCPDAVPARAARSLQQQLYAQLREDVLTGKLAAGARAPSTRGLAETLGVSRTTVVLAYDQLLAEGYLETRRGSGTYVSSRLAPSSESRGAFASTGTTPRRLSAWGRNLALLDPATLERQAPVEIDFRPGRPDWDAFPHTEWSRLAARRWRQASVDLASYGDPAGYGPLREAIAGHLSRSRGVRCDADQVVIVNGSQQGVDLLLRIWVDAGDVAALEDPGYPGAARALEAYGARVLPIPVDDDGLDVSALESAPVSPSTRLVYVTPSHQFPTGATLALARRLRLIEWAREHGALIVEDDYDSEFRYLGRPLESMQGLDTAGTVAYVGSFSKAMFPPLRVGYVVMPRDLVEPYVGAKWLADRQTATPEQQVLYDFMHRGWFDRHLRRMRRLYQSRRVALLEALHRELGGAVTASGDGAGLHLVAWLADGLSAVRVSREAAALGVAAPPISPYYAGRPPREGLMLGFAALDETTIVEGARRLAMAVRSAAGVRGRLTRPDHALALPPGSPVRVPDSSGDLS